MARFSPALLNRGTTRPAFEAARVKGADLGPFPVGSVEVGDFDDVDVRRHAFSFPVFAGLGIIGAADGDEGGKIAADVLIADTAAG